MATFNFSSVEDFAAAKSTLAGDETSDTISFASMATPVITDDVFDSMDSVTGGVSDFENSLIQSDPAGIYTFKTEFGEASKPKKYSQTGSEGSVTYQQG